MIISQFTPSGLNPLLNYFPWSLAVLGRFLLQERFLLERFVAKILVARAGEGGKVLCAQVIHLSPLTASLLVPSSSFLPHHHHHQHNFFPLFVRPLHMTSSFLRAHGPLSRIYNSRTARRNSSASAASTRKFHQPTYYTTSLALRVDVAFGNLSMEESRKKEEKG
jgi:hypothetical protein